MTYYNRWIFYECQYKSHSSRESFKLFIESVMSEDNKEDKQDEESTLDQDTGSSVFPVPIPRFMYILATNS